MSEKPRLRVASLTFHVSVDLAGGLLTAQLHREGTPSLSSSLIHEARPCSLAENGAPCPVPQGQQPMGWQLTRKGRDADEVCFVGNSNIASIRYVVEKAK